jgi:cytochrome c oxidase subunit 3
VVLGTVIFLASELMFFSALFATYYDLKAYNKVWPPAYVHLDQPGMAIGTFMLFVASAVMFPFMRAVRAQRVKPARAWLLTSILAGIGFIGFEWHGWATQGFGIATDAYGSIFMTMTGFHFLHVAAGLIMLAMLYLGLRSPAFLSDERSGVEAISYYWHFVFVVWIGVYATLFLVQ